MADLLLDQVAQQIYDVQHPRHGALWLTTTDDSPNVVSYNAACAVLRLFANLKLDETAIAQVAQHLIGSSLDVRKGSLAEQIAHQIVEMYAEGGYALETQLNEHSDLQAQISILDAPVTEIEIDAVLAEFHGSSRGGRALVSQLIETAFRARRIALTAGGAS